MKKRLSAAIHKQDNDTYEEGLLSGLQQGAVFAGIEIGRLKAKIAEYEKAVEPLIPHVDAYPCDSDKLVVIPPTWLGMGNAVTLGHLRRLVGLRRGDD